LERTEVDDHIRSDSVPVGRRTKPSWRWVDGIAYYGRRAFVPLALRQRVMYTIHDVQSIHAGGKKTIDLLQRSYYWPGMGKDVRKWIGTCDECQRKSKNRKLGMLHSLEIPQHRFTSVAIDFAAAPSAEDGFDQIMVCIDRLRKYLSLAPTKSTYTAAQHAQVFIDTVVKTQGIPQDLVVDRDSTWTSYFWSAIAEHMNIHMNITTARHQNANGLAESSVKTVKRMLTTLQNRPDGASWRSMLPWLQLAYNNTPHTTTGYSPNELTFGSNLSMEMNPADTEVPAADDLAARIASYVERAKRQLEEVQQRQALYYNRGRREDRFQQGQLVLLSSEGISIPTSPKYSYPYLGPFEVLEVLPNDNYHLILPPMMRIHPIFHVSKLFRYRSPMEDSIQAQIQRPPPIAGLEGPERRIERISRHRFHRRGRGITEKQYLCKFAGYDASESVWKSAAEVYERYPELVNTYERSFRDELCDL